MARAIRPITAAIVIILWPQVATAQSVIFQPRPNEVMIESFSLEQVISGVHLSVRAYPFFLVRPIDEILRMDARAVADLSDLQGKIGNLVDTIPSPIENLRIWGKEITIDGNIATLTLKGDALIGPITQPFKATLPFTLQVVDPHTMALETHDPSVELGGALGALLGDLSKQLLRFVGTDITSMLKEALDHAIGPDLLKKSVPEDLLWLNPVITRAEFLNNSGILAASLEMNASLDGKGFIKFIQAATNLAHDDW